MSEKVKEIMHESVNTDSLRNVRSVTMSEKVKELMRESVNTDSLRNVRSVFNRFMLIQDESFFDHELLKDALKRKHISISNFLLRLGCRVKNPNKGDSEETAFHLAMKLDNSPIILKMLKMGASIDDKNVNGETALFTAFAGGYNNSVKTALKFVSTVTRKQLQDDFREYPVKRPDPTNVDNIVHFQIACVTDHCQAVNYYLKRNFDVNQSLILKSDKFVGLNPLQYAATKSLSSHLIEILLRNNGDLSLKSSNGRTMLHILYYSGCFYYYTRNIMELVFHDGNDTKFINSVDNNNVSHFHMFCAINYPEAVKVFIDKGVDVNSPISSSCSMNPGYTPLHIAVKQHCEKVVKLLLENGANSRATSTDGTTPLHLACKLSIRDQRRFSIICMLMAHNANPAAVDTNNYTPLHLAFLHMSLREEIRTFDSLISKIPWKVNYYDNDGLSHFHIVCIRNNVSRVNDFLQSGIDVNCCVKSKKYDGYTALHFAVLYNQKDVVEELLKWNAQVNIKTLKSQLTPLHLACNFNHRKFHEINIRDKDPGNWISNRRNQLDIIKLLLLHGANVDDQDSSGKTPLLNTTTIDTVCYDANSSEINTRIKEIIDILLVNKANLNACTNSQESVLHLVTEKFHPKKSEEIVEHLLSIGANVNAVNDDGYTPLHSAVILIKKELVQIFLKHGADVNAKSKNLLIPLQMIEETATFCFHFHTYTNLLNDIVCMLLENGSYVNVRNKSTKTLLQSAIQSCNNFIIEKLLYYGADINMEDSNGNSTVFPLSTWEIQSSTDDLILNDSRASGKVFLTIFTHVQKLEALGLYVSKQVQMLCSKFYQRYYKNLLFKRLSNVFDDCVKELDKMKSTKIDNYTSLYNILLKNAHEISKHVNNSTLIQILEDPNVNDEFPLYSFLLKLQYKNGLKRSKLSKLTKLPYVINVNLPDLCYDSILKFLSNEDLINLQALATVKGNCKRKLNSDNSKDEEEPSLKIAKVV